ncbi:MAG: hypothetical protein ACYDCQ_00170 [Dehalococcoidia bacterium]
MRALPTRRTISDNQAPATPEWELVRLALRELSGFAQHVIYDVPRAEAPWPLRDGSMYLHGSPTWLRYLSARRRVDNGSFTAVLALRPLGDVERLLAVDWGSSYSNTFLLIEPRLPDSDLTRTDDPLRQELEAAARSLPRDRRLPRAGGALELPDSVLGRRLRDAYGLWTYWTGSREAWRVDQVVLEPSEQADTLAGLMRLHFPVRFPQAAFDRTMAELWSKERELFSGTVARARIPFCSRLGLPLLHDARYADRAFRRLVNAGRATVFARDQRGTIRYGPAWPVPSDMREEEFEQLSL